ncbi:MAG TPA: aldo/keto reductase [Acidobacteriota bacterium]|jgi:predicted aldo/keto reductase-like oxidoreductase|nr:aldo/keto reductase [Acidobacteriota bacterium]
MKFRRFGRLNWKASALGFGVMRLPTIGGDAAKINKPVATRMLRYAIDHGVNYLDTAYTYHGGNSEAFLGKVLQGEYREKVKLATKMPTWLVNSQQDMDKYLDEQLIRLKTNIDFYLLHGLTKERWQKLRELNVTSWLEKKQDEGKISHLGFSFHDTYGVFRDIIDSYDGWTFCQIQYNYVDADHQAGTEGLMYAASKGLAVVVMEPVAGGRLAITPPKQVQSLWKKAEIKRTPAELALLWVWNHPEASVALSGMSTMQQVIENVKTANHSVPPTLSQEELRFIGELAQKYKKLGFIGCTGCRYCMPCDSGVSIPEIIAFVNEFYIKDGSEELKTRYHRHVKPENQAEKCVKCGKCEQRCPQQLPIRDILSRAVWIFEKSDQ